jgi:hypothetical protein
MDLKTKVSASPNACKIGLYFSGSPVPAVNTSASNFFDTVINSDQEADVYHTSPLRKFLNKRQLVRFLIKL